MPITHLNPSGNNTNQVSCSDLVSVNQLIVEPICSWRSEYNAQLELKVTSDGENIRYSVYNHHPNVRCYWPNSASSSMVFLSVFTHCVWKSNAKSIESRLFSNGSMAVLVSFTLINKTIGIKEWIDDYLEKFLVKNNPIVLTVNNDHSVEFQEEIRETPRNKPYDSEAEEGITRWRRTPKGELVKMEEEPITEETLKVWPGPRDIRLIKFVDKQREEILCRAFSWENKKNPVIPSRLAADADSNSHATLSVDAIIECILECTPTFENVQNIEKITFYREHPLNYFMPDYVLSRTEASEVQRWVYEQFYRKEGENKLPFEYTNFVSAKKIAFSFGKKKQQNALKNVPEVETWHVEMKRQASWALQFPIGISNFFAGIFLTNVQNLTLVDKDAVERLVQGVPLFDVERNQIVDDFAVELGNCSIINFYIACDRSVSQLEIDGRAWIRSFVNAGRGIRGAVVHGAEGLGHLVGTINLDTANRAISNAADLIEGANKLRQGLQILKGVSPPQNNPEMDKNIREYTYS